VDAPRIPSTGATTLDIDGRRVELTSLGKVLWPQSGFTKAEMVGYYAAVAPALLPSVEDPALTLGRWPEGVEGRGFAQTECRGRPSWIKTTPVRLRSGEVRRHCLIADLASLLWVANQNAIELHAFLHRFRKPDHPTAALFDLDPKPGFGVVDCCRVALRLRRAVTNRRMRCSVKTSGSAGLHVLVPWERPRSYAESKEFVRSLTLQDLEADRVRIDWAQNNSGRTTVVAYSLRATSRPSVSLPLSWEEVQQVAESGDDSPLYPSPLQVARRVRQLSAGPD
jgi:bifunctional non-homologous end joining protein LigD